MPSERPDATEVARRNPRFDLRRLARFEESERMASRLGVEEPRYRVDPPLGSAPVIVDGQDIVSAVRPKK